MSPLAHAVWEMAGRLADASTALALARTARELTVASRVYSRRYRALARLVTALDRQEATR